MSTSILCDFCGRPMVSDHVAGTARVESRGNYELPDDGSRILAPRLPTEIRHYCTGQENPADEDEPSCYRRAMAALDAAAKQYQSDLGLEWRLVPRDGGQ